MKSIVNIYSALLLVLVSALNAYSSADNPSEIYRKANEAYMNHSYEEAAELYEQAVKAGFISPEVYYNMGNAYYKSGNIAKSVLSFERAKKLDPSDPDIQYNLSVAYQATIDKIEPVPLVFYERWWQNFVHGGSVNRRAFWFVGFLWTTLLLVAGYLFLKRVYLRKLMFFAALTTLTCALFTGYLTYLQYRHLNHNRGAIIFSDSAYVKSSPDESSSNLFMLHAGTRIEVVDELQGWKKIRIANGSEGWIVQDAIELI
jgi:hypothetical protein